MLETRSCVAPHGDGMEQWPFRGAYPEMGTLPGDLQNPVDRNWTDPFDNRERFELRQSAGDQVVVTAFKRWKPRPPLVFETGDGYPRYLVHAGSVLVFQSTGGASDHVFVFVFRSGKPSLVPQTATKDLIQVNQSSASIRVLVPPPTYPGADGQFSQQVPPQKYSFQFDQ